MGDPAAQRDLQTWYAYKWKYQMENALQEVDSPNG